MLQTSAVRRTATAALALTVSFSLMACNTNKPPVASNITSVTVSAPKTSLAIGETTQATADVVVTNNAAKTVTWSTTNANVATVNASTGEVQAVAVGDADIVATSTVDATKKGKVTITVTAVPAPTTIKFAFRTAAAPAADGYTSDTGTGWNGTKGWVTEATAGTANPTAINMTSAARYRTANTEPNLTPQQLGAILMDCGDVPSGNKCLTGTETGPAAWEHVLPNGNYVVKVSVGDADKGNINSSHVINVEGMNVVAAVTPAAGAFAIGTKTVNVADGRLTVDSKTGKNTKINYIEITPAP